jgi:hypothetical protein
MADGGWRMADGGWRIFKSAIRNPQSLSTAEGYLARNGLCRGQSITLRQSE